MSDRDFNRRNFNRSTEGTNPYFPLVPGTRFTWKGHASIDGERVSRTIETTITDMTKVIAGVKTVVGRDVDMTDGAVNELELTFFAQDDFGNVWYFGEYSEEYEDGEFVESPTWLAGLRGARAGVMMPARPQRGTPDYAEGWGPEVDWSDRGKVHRVGIKDCVPVSCYRNVVVIDEFSFDEPGMHQLKYYAPDVGGIRTSWHGANETEREELTLTSLKRLSPRELNQLRKDIIEQDRRGYQRSPRVYAKTAPIERR